MKHDRGCMAKWLFVICLLSLGVTGLPPQAEAAEFTILHTAGVTGHLLPCPT
jgi:hypothetical protein